MKRDKLIVESWCIPNELITEQEFRSMRGEFGEICDKHFEMVVESAFTEDTITLEQFAHISEVIQASGTMNEQELINGIKNWERTNMTRSQAQQMLMERFEVSGKAQIDHKNLQYYFLQFQEQQKTIT